MNLPTVLSSKQVAEKLGIERQNMTNQKKAKGFPKPFWIVDKFPMWLESDIEKWMEDKAEKKKAK